ncbi:unnamed protein product [Urochloa humidicola]
MEDDQQQLAAAARDLAAFSMLLVRHLGENSKNMALSPMSLHAILSLLAAGATGAVRDQIVSFLGPAGGDAHEALSSKVASYVLATHENVDEQVEDDEEDAPTPPPEVRCAMGVWVESSSLVLNPAFVTMAASKYKADVQAISFTNTPAQARAEINKWFESKTGGHVQSLLPESSISSSTTLLILANALYFRGYWYDPFLPEMTRDGAFHVSVSPAGNREVTVPFMVGNDLHARMHVGCHPGFKVLQMAYAAGMMSAAEAEQSCFSMYIYLPDDRDGLPGLVRQLSSDPAALLHGDVVPDRRVLVGDLRIPKFDVSLKADAARLLADLGLDLAGHSSEMVEAAGDVLPPMAVPSPSIVQHCSVKVNEIGTVAAAATALEILGFGMDDPEIAVDFVADHPFLFFIKEDRSRVVVFAGQVVDPSSPQ